MTATTVHIHRRDGKMPKAHRAAILSAPWLGRFVIVYGNGRDSWREWTGGIGGFTYRENAEAEVKRVWGRRR